MANEMNFFKRLAGETPKYWKRIIAIAASASASAAALLAVPELKFPATIQQGLHYLVVTGIVVSIIAKSAVTTPSNEIPKP